MSTESEVKFSAEKSILPNTEKVFWFPVFLVSASMNPSSKPFSQLSFVCRLVRETLRRLWD
jgi:hypothetical protein